METVQVLRKFIDPKNASGVAKEQLIKLNKALSNDDFKVILKNRKEIMKETVRLSPKAEEAERLVTAKHVLSQYIGDKKAQIVYDTWATPEVMKMANKYEGRKMTARAALMQKRGV